VLKFVSKSNLNALLVILGEMNSDQLWQGLFTKSCIPTSYLNLADRINFSNCNPAPFSIFSNKIFNSSKLSGTLIFSCEKIISNCGFNEINSKKSEVL